MDGEKRQHGRRRQWRRRPGLRSSGVEKLQIASMHAWRLKKTTKKTCARKHTEKKHQPYLLSINSVCCCAIAAAIASSAMSIFYRSTRVLQASSAAIAPLSLLLLLTNLAISPQSFPCRHLRSSVYQCSNQSGSFPVPLPFSLSTQGTSPWQKGANCDMP